MTIPESILALENRSTGDRGEPTLGRALELAVDEWRSGNRDRELALHLLFLSWYCNLEPPHLTGYDESRIPSTDLPFLFQEIYASVSDTIMDDEECLFVVGLIASLTPWLLGENVSTWEARSVKFRARYRQLQPNGLPAAHFDGRGAYGDYFAAQVVVAGGF
ncbi:MAG TPA: hypothetical protein VIV60_09995 [Polyangiaceae bacterium]